MMGSEVIYLEKANELRQAIREGKYANGRFLSETQLMRKFGIGRQTAIRILNVLQREGLIVRRKGAGTFLSKTGRRMTGRIGLVIHGSDYCEMFSPVARHFSHLCQQKGLALLFADVSCADNSKRAAEVIRTVREVVETGVDGVIFHPLELMRNATDLNHEIMKLFDAAQIPVVLLDSDIVQSPERSAYDLASVNHFEAGRRLAKHLRDVGAHRIAYLVQPNHAPCVQERQLGVKTGCEGLELAGKALLAEPDDAALIGRFLRRERPDAIACYNDRQAAILVKTLAALGRRVPDDILVAGFDDVNFARLSTPTLTTLHQPCQELAELAFEMLQARLHHPEAPVREVFLTAPLVVRESTMRPSTGEARQNFCKVRKQKGTKVKETNQRKRGQK